WGSAKLPYAILIACLFMFGLSPLSAQEEESKPVFVTIQYMKVKPSNISAYLELESLWKKMHQARVKSGELLYWGLHQVVSPTGTDAAYNFTTVNLYEGEEALAAHYEGDMSVDMSELYTEDEMKIMQKTSELRDLVKEEVYFRTLRVTDGKPGAELIVTNFMQLAEDATLADHTELEAIWSKVHQARVDDGKMKAWSSWDMVLPMNSDGEYQAITVDFYEDMAQWMAPFYQEYFAKVYPDMDLEGLSAKMEAVFKIYRSEVMMRIDGTD
ncbi:MAG: hypothetical protein AAFN10_20665, partial [Bacteroidota bacterium]